MLRMLCWILNFCQRLLLFYSFIHIPNCQAQMFIILETDKKKSSRKGKLQFIQLECVQNSNAI